MSNLNVTTVQNTSSVNSITIDTSGRVLYPQNPAFCARNCSNPTGSSGVRTIIFTTVDLNVGSCYNSTNGRFTAPTSGLYYLTYHLFGDGNTQRHLSTLTINGFTVVEDTVETTAGAGSGYSNLQTSILYYMNNSDYAEVRATAKIIGSDNAYACFSGFLVGG